MESKLYSLEEVIRFIEEGKLLALAGDQKLMQKLPKGNWIGGSIPYFMNVDKGQLNQEKIFVNEFKPQTENFRIKNYTSESIKDLSKDAFSNGYTILIVPAFQNIHQDFALKAPSISGIFENPVTGWISGINLNSNDIPQVYDGTKGKQIADEAIALHIELPKNQIAHLDIVNIFEPNSNSDEIQFFQDGFECTDCLINGKKENFAEYLERNQTDTKLPIIANYSGARINVSFKEINNNEKKVSFYAPIFKDNIYKFALPVDNYVEEFESKLPRINSKLQFSCNCILNYLYGKLENKQIANFAGPITFGEIGYQLLNQTLTYLTIKDI